jgi:hypothetical protein
VPVLIAALLYGVGIFYLVEFTRTLPLIDRWVAEARKPWACHVCMSGWGSIATHLGLIYGADMSMLWWITGPASAGVALLLLYASDALSGIHPPMLE